MRQLIPYVNYMLADELSVAGVISKPLAEVPPLALTDSARALVRSYQESWCHENARISLSHPGVYEVARNPFELDTLAPQFGGERIQGICCAWVQLNACAQLWTDAKFKASSTDESKRRWFYPSFLATAISDLTRVVKDGVFVDLPLLAGHVVLWSWYVRVDGVLQATPSPERTTKLIKLWEAVMSASLRFRLTPSRQQVMLDRMAWSEDLLVVSKHAADSFAEFCLNLYQLPDLNLANKNWAMKPFAEELARQGIQYGGKPLADSATKAILAAMPFLRDEAILAAYRELEALTTAVGEQAKLMRICQIAKVNYVKEPRRAFLFMLEALRLNLAFADLDEQDITTAFLVGSHQPSSDMGFAGACCAKVKFMDWFAAATKFQRVGGDGEAAPEYKEVAAEILDNVWPHFASPMSFWKKFAGTAAGGMLLEAATAGDYQKYRGGLHTEGAKLCADILKNIYTNTFDDEFLSLAADSNIVWSEYLQSRQGEPEPCSALQKLYGEYLQTLSRNPVQIGEVAGEGPEAMAAPVDVTGAAHSDSEHEERTLLYQNMCAKRRAQVEFFGIPKTRGGADSFRDKGPIEDLYKQSRAAKFEGRAGEQHRAWMVSATLLTGPEVLGAKDYKTNAFTPALRSAVELMLKLRDHADVCFAFDGRSEDARDVINDAVKGSVTDRNRRATCHFNFSPPQANDPRFPEQKFAFAANWTETAALVLPMGKKLMKTKPRDDPYTGGEALTTHSLLYSKVPVRSLEEHPRLTPEARTKVHGGTSAPVYTRKAVLELVKNGVPLCWHEMLPIELYVALYKHFDIKHVCDMSPGSGAAAIAALLGDVSYTGLCRNEEHMAWLNKILDTAYLTVLTDGAKQRDQKLRDRLLFFVAPVVDDAKRMLRAEAALDTAAPDESDDSAV